MSASRSSHPATLTGVELRAGVQAALGEFLARQSASMAEISPHLTPLAQTITEFVAGGKRLRPAFCVWGYIGAGGTDIERAVAAASSLELVQACALIHDDVMDASLTRRGRPAAHRQFAHLHESSGWRGSADRFGDGAAILAGDLCLAWADELLRDCGLPMAALEAARPWYDLMRTEVMCGQYLDLTEQAQGDGSPAAAVLVVQYKTVKYTTERPLQIGAALAGGASELISGLSRYGQPVGEAFQFRDDILGVFGDPAATGKPAGDDLREGKRTLLVALALQRATPAQRRILMSGLGRADLDATGIEHMRETISATGALAELEQVIAARVVRAREALADLEVTPAGREQLYELAGIAADRSV